MPNLAKVQEESNPSNTGVISLNGKTGAVNIVAGQNMAVTPVGQNVTVASVYYSQYDYLVYYDGAYYRAVNWQGVLTYGGSASGVGSVSGTTADTVINACYTAVNNAGVIMLKASTTYTCTATLNFAGSATDTYSQHSGVWFLGGGWTTIISQTGSGVNGITLSNRAVVNLQNFQVNMPTSSSGNGIFGADTGAQSKDAIIFSYLDNIEVVGGDSSHTAIWIKNPYNSYFGYFSCAVNGNGITFDATDTATHIGNCYFKYLYCNSQSSSSYALTVQALVTSSAINLVKFEQLNLDTQGGGIHLAVANGGSVTNSWFYGLDLEGQTTQIFIDVQNTTNGSNIRYNHFQGYMTAQTGQTAINASTNGANHGGNNFDLNVVLNDNSAATVIINDATNIYEVEVVYNINFFSSGTAATTNQYVLGAGVKITWVGYGIKNPSSGAAANVADGGTITHNVGLTPTWVMITGSIAAQEYAVTSIGATTFTVAIKTTGGLAGTTQTIYWRAGYNSD
jgi:hypothetical protein